MACFNSLVTVTGEHWTNPILLTSLLVSWQGGFTNKCSRQTK